VPAPDQHQAEISNRLSAPPGGTQKLFHFRVGQEIFSASVNRLINGFLIFGIFSFVVSGLFRHFFDSLHSRVSACGFLNFENSIIYRSRR
jgi:hypothetical protein